MYSRWFDASVVLLWLATMTWLVTQKVLPALLVGEPPSYSAVLGTEQNELPVCWTMQWNDRQLGWALNSRSPMPNGSTEVRSRVHFDELPLGELIPNWLNLLLEPLDELEAELRMETLSSLVFDPQGRLCRFKSSVQFQAGVNAVDVEGVIEGALLSLNVRSGEFVYETEMLLPRKAMLSDALSPQTQLSGLHKGQTWTMEVYSPLRAAAPGRQGLVEILQAKVEDMQPMVWDGQPVETWLVAYRNDPGFGLGSTDNPRVRLWVHPDGTVLKQQVKIFDSTMTFVRLPDEEAARLAGKAADRAGGCERMPYPASAGQDVNTGRLKGKRD